MVCHDKELCDLRIPNQYLTDQIFGPFSISVDRDSATKRPAKVIKTSEIYILHY